jgi:serine/threonine-protein kinase
MPAPSSIDQKTFLANLVQSGLVSAQDLEALAVRLPDTNRGRVVARALVEMGVLTKFQAERLLAGRTSGFMLGQYRVLDCLGQGGMGSVFKAIHVTMNRTVALKVLAPRLMETEQAQILFLREMRALAQLAHPNLVTAYDANQIGRRYYLVMEYVDGPNLDQLVRDQGALPIGLACELIRQAAHGLQYAHEMGMVHRDIKPSNLLVLLPGGNHRRRSCQVKILDFGLARLQDSPEGTLDASGTILTRANVVIGTPDFVAPEQAKDLHAADIRSDLYSLGCTFHYLLTGEVPFPGGSTVEKLVRHATEEAVSVYSVRPDVPMAISNLVKRLMAKDPNERFATPAELATALGPYAVPESIPESYTNPALPSSDTLMTPAPMPKDPFTSLDTEQRGREELLAPFSALDEIAALVNTSLPDLSRTTLLDRMSHYPRGYRRFWDTGPRRFILALVTALLILAGVMTAFLILGSR